jgi:acyl-CoA synthetase (NDP forming)
VTVDLGPLLRPRRVAVVGASNREGRPNTAIWRRMAAWGDEVGAAVVPVNPRLDEVDGRPSHPDLASATAAGGRLDLVVVLVGDPVATIEHAVACDARFAVVFAAGFSEVGEAGAERQSALRRAVAGSELRILGPNTNLNAFESFRSDLSGPGIALLTQSGHQGRPLFMAQELGIRLSGWVPTGNEVDIELADCIEWFADQPDTGVIAVYAEGFKDGDRFRAALDHAARRRVPVVIVKVGRSPAGADAARSHTGKLAGSDAVVDAVLAQHGAVRVDDLDELLDCAQLLARHPDPPTVPDGGAVVYSISGGTGAHAVDLLSAAGVGLAHLSAPLQDELHELIPADLNVANPVDSGGHPVGDERGARILELLVDAPETGALVVPVTGPFPPLSDVLARDLVATAERTDTPICVVWGSPLGDEPAFRSVLAGSSRLVVHRRLSNTARALRAWRDWHEHLRHRAVDESEPAWPEDALPATGLADLSVLAAGRALDEHEAKALVAAFGVPVTDDVVARDAGEAVVAWRRLGGAEPGAPEPGPVVMKALSSSLLHKSEVGGVRVGVAGAEDVAQAFVELAALGDGRVLVCPLAEGDGAVEMVVGLTTDLVFGKVVAVGAGGVLAEVVDDVALCVPPFSRADARRALSGLRSWALLAGARGRPPADVDALLDVVMAVQRLAVAAGPALHELDLNPVLVGPAGRGAVALDALVVPSSRGEAPPTGAG